MENELLQSGSIIVGLLAIITLIIRELFAYLKTKNGNGGNGMSGAIFTELRTMNNNHLHSIQDSIEQGNNRLIDTIHNDNTKIIELLGEIRGGLRR